MAVKQELQPIAPMPKTEKPSTTIKQDSDAGQGETVAKTPISSVTPTVKAQSEVTTTTPKQVTMSQSTGEPSHEQLLQGQPPGTVIKCVTAQVTFSITTLKK